MARRIIATAEVLVQANVNPAEAGINSLTQSFREIGQVAERAAKAAEVAFFNGAKSMEGGLKRVKIATDEMLDELKQGGEVSRELGKALERAADEAQKLARVDIDAGAERALGVYREGVVILGRMTGNMESAKKMATRLAEEAAEIEEGIREAERAAKRLGEAFRDVGQDIELALAGGVEGLQDDIRETIRRLGDMGEEAREVAGIVERSFSNIMGEFDNEVEQATSALMGLQRIASRALEGLDNDANDAAAALRRLDGAAEKADRSIAGIGGVARNTTGSVRGLVTMLGTAGLGYAVVNATSFGLEMTVQLEKAEAMFLGLTGSVEGASNMLERMVTFARETPYNLGQVTESAAQLLAVGDGFGVTTANIEDYLTSFGEAITMTGGGDEQFGRLVRVFGQMSSSGKVLGQDMNQLAQNLPGYDVWQTLADGAGISVEELRRLQNIGQLDELLTGNEAVQILIDGMEKIPGAAGAMERRMDTLGGAFEKFKETAQLAVSDGLKPFAETAQDALSDPVILTAVENVSQAFGDLMSEGLAAIEPEIDDLAAAFEGLLVALKDWAPVAGQVVDMLGDFVAFITPVVSVLGKLTSAVLSAEDGLGKMAIAWGAFALGGPIGIAVGVLAGVSGAIDAFADDSETAANTARLLAAAQDSVNIAMKESEPEILTAGQEAALAVAKDLRENYKQLTDVMLTYGLSFQEVQAGLTAMGTGVGEVTPQFQAFYDTLKNNDFDTFTKRELGDLALEQLNTFASAMEETTTVVETETQKQNDLWVLANATKVGLDEEAIASAIRASEQLDEIRAKNNAAVQKSSQEEVDAAIESAAQLDEIRAGHYAAAQEYAENGRALSEEETETMTGLLQEQADAYQQWADDIDASTQAASLSFSGLAADSNNSVDEMIAKLNDNSVAVSDWKSDIATAAATVGERLGLTATEIGTFAGQLGDVGIDFAPALDEMVNSGETGGAQIEGLFQAMATAAATESASLIDEVETASGAVPTLAEKMAEGTLTIEEVLAAIPAAMKEEGLNFEAAAAAIDASDELRDVGEQAVNGLVGALEAGISRARGAAARLAAAVSGGAAVSLQVRSPSRVMMEIGEFAVEGLIVGMQNMSDDAYAEAIQTASILSGGIAWHFRNEDDPMDAAREFAEKISKAIIDELMAEREAVADAAEALADAAADRLDATWGRVEARFKNTDINKAINGAQAEIKAAQAELKQAEKLTGTAGKVALAKAEKRVAAAEKAVAAAEAADATGDAGAETMLLAFKRAAGDADGALGRSQRDREYALQDRQKAEINALKKDQAAAIADAQYRIKDANRNLDPVARAQAEAALREAQDNALMELANERHRREMVALKDQSDAEKLALDRRQEDEQNLFEKKLDHENELREAALKSQQDQLKAFEAAAKEMTKAIADAVKDHLAAVEALAKAKESSAGAWFDRFKVQVANGKANLKDVRAAGKKAGLTAAEVDQIIRDTQNAKSTAGTADRATQAVDDLLKSLSVKGLYTLGANGALGIAAGISSESRAIAVAMQASVQAAVTAALKALQIKSPSRVTEKMIGKPMAQGIAVGLTKAIPEVGYAMTGLLGSVMSGSRPPTSGLDSSAQSSSAGAIGTGFSGPLVSMQGTVIQDATDADLVAQRTIAALSAAGMSL